MAKTPKIRLIRDKRRDILAEIVHHEQEVARLEDAIASLKVQASELEIAERVLASLSADDDEDAEAESAGTHDVADGGISTDKPSDLPTMPEMIIDALTDARKNGKRGLAPKEIVQCIREKWWANVPPESVGPVAWRMWNKDHKLTKRETRYFLPKHDDNSES
jgi:hypothetical protein